MVGLVWLESTGVVREWSDVVREWSTHLCPSHRVVGLMWLESGWYDVVREWSDVVREWLV